MSINWPKAVIGPCIAVFGEPVTYTPATGSPFTINGVFDNAWQDMKPSEYAPPVSSVHPVLGVNLADFPAPPKQGDRYQVQGSGKTYIVREPRPDSHGGALLISNYVSG